MSDGSRKIAVVTGASAGVGRATARAFAEHGFDVALLARGAAGLEGAAKDVEAAGGRALAVPTDVAEWEHVEAAARRVEAELGEIDVWVNNAMTTVFEWFTGVEAADYARATEVTYLGQVWGTRAALDRMLPRDRGTIVNVGSALAFVAIPLQSAYCGAKYAVRGFTESVQAELAHKGSKVRVSMVHLPAVNTPQFGWCQAEVDKHPQPVPPIYQPEVPAKFIVQAALDGRRAKVLGAWNKLLVVANKVAPQVVSHYAARSAVGGQLTDREVRADRPSNLWEPVDVHDDYGAHGIFDDRAGGTLDPSFLTQLPKTAKTVMLAAGDALRDKLDRYRAA